MTITNGLDANHLRAFVERVNELLNYDPETGILTWKRRTSNRVKVGSEAGSINQGYLEISIDNTTYRATHLAWVICFGKLPSAFIDHINGNRSDNRILNLREATPEQNARNSASHFDNISGVKGVHVHHGRNKPFQARIFVNGRNKSLGYFETAKDAGEAYAKAASFYFGEFARAS